MVAVIDTSLLKGSVLNYRLRFLANLLTELAEQLSLSATRDLSYLLSRFEHEGMSFLTITLPTFCDGLESALERGYALSSDFPAFARKRTGCLPKFLSGFSSFVFDDTGQVKVDALPDAIFGMRQITRYYKKALIGCSPERTAKAELQYVNTDKELAYYDEKISTRFRLEHNLDRISRTILRSLCRNFSISTPNCRHGPGATAERLSRNSRQRIRQWPIRAEPYFPASYHAIPNAGWLGELRKISLLSHGSEPPVRVVFVPKTLKTPRVIAVEPSHMQFMQQGVLRWLVPEIERNPLTRNSVHFTDQSINRASALAASVSGLNATIDLSEASDRVSLTLVKEIFKHNPLFLATILSCRSETAQIPSGDIIHLNKFASMGSALCFPIEALCFYILIQSAVHRMLGIQASGRSISNISKYVHVYGDDLIVPCAWLDFVVKELEDFGLRVNASKSFSKSLFRESCGGDYYNGYDVKPSYLRIDPSRLNKRLSPNELVSLSQHSNQLYALGLWKSCQFIRDIISRHSRLPIPVRTSIDDSTPGITFLSCRRNTYNRWSHRFQRPISKALTYIPISQKDDISADAVASVMYALTNIGNDYSIELQTSVRARTLRQKTGWVV